MTEISLLSDSNYYGEYSEGGQIRENVGQLRYCKLHNYVVEYSENSIIWHSEYLNCSKFQRLLDYQVFLNNYYSLVL